MIPSGLEPAAQKIQEQNAAAAHRWREIPIADDMPAASRRIAFRLNALGNLFFFSKVVLGHSRLSSGLHGYMCARLERERLRLVEEIPRDHFKTTVASISNPMWRSLPFTAQDEDYMREYLGYGDDWIRWMYKAHYTSRRTLIASEVIANARKIGTRIAGHYESNAVFRLLFPEIIPKDKTFQNTSPGCKGGKRWNQDSIVHNRIDGVFHGEGTYDFIGAKGALQSRHYDSIVEDDMVGEKAIHSDLVMEGIIDWHRKLPGAFDSDPDNPGNLGDQLVIGNRWSYRDLNSWIRENEPDYEFDTHSALGGCCSLHPAGEPIFPEEFTKEKLDSIRRTEGSYHFSAQFENNPTAPGAVRFKPSWLRHYSLDAWSEPSGQSKIVNWQQLPYETRKEINGGESEDAAEAAGAMPRRLKVALHHEVDSGETIEDIRAGELDRVCILDPNHSQQQGRSRHAIVVLGVLNRPPAPRRIYLLDVWAKASSFEEMIEACIGVKAGSRGLAVKWKVHYLYIESDVAGQQGWRYFFQEKVNRMGLEASFSIRQLKTDRSAGGKDRRIIGMEPLYEAGMFWVRRKGQEEFLHEYSMYPNGRTNDIIDVLGYAPQTWHLGSRAQARDFVAEEMRKRERLIQSVGSAGY